MQTFIAVGFLIVVLVFPPDKYGLWLGIAAGMLLGAQLRDLRLMALVRKSWPFTEKVTDWEKVEELARVE